MMLGTVKSILTMWIELAKTIQITCPALIRSNRQDGHRGWSIAHGLTGGSGGVV